MATTMKAVVVPGDKCAAHELVLGEVTRPEARSGEILVAVEAAGVNRPDIVQRNGLYPPPLGAWTILGLDISGVVEQAWAGGKRAIPYAHSWAVAAMPNTRPLIRDTRYRSQAD